METSSSVREEVVSASAHSPKQRVKAKNQGGESYQDLVGRSPDRYALDSELPEHGLLEEHRSWSELCSSNRKCSRSIAHGVFFGGRSSVQSTSSAGRSQLGTQWVWGVVASGIVGEQMTSWCRGRHSLTELQLFWAQVGLVQALDVCFGALGALRGSR